MHLPPKKNVTFTYQEQLLWFLTGLGWNCNAHLVASSRRPAWAPRSRTLQCHHPQNRPPPAMEQNPPGSSCPNLSLPTCSAVAGLIVRVTIRKEEPISIVMGIQARHLPKVTPQQWMVEKPLLDLIIRSCNDCWWLISPTKIRIIGRSPLEGLVASLWTSPRHQRKASKLALMITSALCS